MEIYIKETGKIIIKMDKVNIFGKVEIYMKENGKIIIEMDKVN